MNAKKTTAKQKKRVILQGKLINQNMISKNQIKLIHALEQKKYRIKENAFVAEGPKLISDILPYFRCRMLVATEKWLTEHVAVQNRLQHSGCTILPVHEEELKKVSLLKTPQDVLAVFECRKTILPEKLDSGKLYIALDDIQDPGNLGTIIRLADWFGIEDIFCSSGTADQYNPKTIQATMGAIARVRLHYLDLPNFLLQQKHMPVYGTTLDGSDLYRTSITPGGIIVMGNEGNGISEAVKKLLTDKLYIPNYPAERSTSESLNVAIATAIVCAEFRRRNY